MIPIILGFFVIGSIIGGIVGYVSGKGPKLEIEEPPEDLTTSKAVITVSGRTEPTATLEVNNEQRKVLKDGSFIFTLSLEEGGSTTLKFIAADKSGNTTVKERTVTYDATVYVTPTGSKYHRADCRYIVKGCSPIFLTEAKAQGYTA